MDDTVPSTPVRTRKSSMVLTTPTTTRVSSAVLTTSPHYTTTRRHSLYGTEDRIIIDPGSAVWKVGFSGEPRPRAVFHVQNNNKSALWSSGELGTADEREEEERHLSNELQHELRKVFHSILLTDPKSRKIIIVEHPLLPTYVKELIGRILFQNLLVPSISFAPSGLLSLLSVGRITGIVLDCGHLETTVLPFYSSRPLYPHIQTTPLAGHRLNSHIRALLLRFSSYFPPPQSLSGAANLHAAPRATRVPEEVLNDHVVEEIKTRCCLVGEPLQRSNHSKGKSSPTKDNDDHEPAPWPPSSDPVSMESDIDDEEEEEEDPNISAINSLYRNHSTATDLRMHVTPPPSQQTGTGMGTLVIPGWIRERAAEVLFDGGDVDEHSVVEVVLECLRKVPIDLRSELASSILVAGGTAMLPGFTIRLRKQLQIALEAPDTVIKPGRSPYDRYSSIRSLQPAITILNDPNPTVPSSLNNFKAGRAPAFSPALLAWVGGSLAGSLKTGGHELIREKWDEAWAAVASNRDESVNLMRSTILPDWTRAPLPVGAPIANVLLLQSTAG